MITGSNPRGLRFNPQLQITNAVIAPIAVQMVNLLLICKWSSKLISHYYAMFKVYFSITHIDHYIAAFGQSFSTLPPWTFRHLCSSLNPSRAMMWHIGHWMALKLSLLRTSFWRNFRLAATSALTYTSRNFFWQRSYLLATSSTSQMVSRQIKRCVSSVRREWFSTSTSTCLVRLSRLSISFQRSVSIYVSSFRSVVRRHFFVATAFTFSHISYYHTTIATSNT